VSDDSHSASSGIGHFAPKPFIELLLFKPSFLKLDFLFSFHFKDVLMLFVEACMHTPLSAIRRVEAAYSDSHAFKRMT
jgi:hypothetical protein